MPKGINNVNYVTHDNCITKNQQSHKMYRTKVDHIFYFILFYFIFENNHNYMRVFHLEGEVY
jgi:hypothetical protein